MSDNNDGYKQKALDDTVDGNFDVVFCGRVGEKNIGRRQGKRRRNLSLRRKKTQSDVTFQMRFQQAETTVPGCGEAVSA